MRNLVSPELQAYYDRYDFGVSKNPPVMWGVGVRTGAVSVTPITSIEEPWKNKGFVFNDKDSGEIREYVREMVRQFKEIDVKITCTPTGVSVSLSDDATAVSWSTSTPIQGDVKTETLNRSDSINTVRFSFV